MKNRNGKLYIVATPIGNLADITLRALEILKNVDCILCEDTRVTNVLLRHHTIKKPLMVYNDHSNELARDKILSKLFTGENLALVSDAGTPLISDPGYKLIKILQENNINIETIPGPCSPIAALTLSAIPSDRFSFLGFLPNKQNAKEKIFKEFQSLNSTLIFFESPNRLIESLALMKDFFNDRIIVIAREITKLYEERISGTIDDIIKYYLEHNDKLRGEIIILISPPRDDNFVNEEQVRAELEKLLKKMSLKDAVQNVAEHHPISKKEVYKIALTLKELTL